VLSRRLAEANHYPAVDVLGSISRLAPAVSGRETQRAAGYIRRLLAVYGESEDLINVGAYHQGTNPLIDEAIAKKQAIDSLLVQAVDERSSLVETLQVMSEISGISIPVEEMSAYQSGDRAFPEGASASERETGEMPPGRQSANETETGEAAAGGREREGPERML
jgi:flagellum-specific ATP synthase